DSFPPSLHDALPICLGVSGEDLLDVDGDLFAAPHDERPPRRRLGGDAPGPGQEIGHALTFQEIIRARRADLPSRVSCNGRKSYRAEEQTSELQSREK